MLIAVLMVTLGLHFLRKPKSPWGSGVYPQCKIHLEIIREIKDRKQTLVEQARLLITPEQAKELILKRWQTILHQTINGYLQTHSRQLLIAIEHLHSKYTTPLHSILETRETGTQLLNGYLMELGYE